MKLRYKASVILAAATFFSTVTSAEETSYGRGVGTATCAEFGRLYKSDPHNIEVIFFSWAQGFLTGWNLAVSDAVRRINLSTWDQEKQQAYIRRYCDAHPLKQYVEAVIALYKALKSGEEMTSSPKGVN